MTDAAVHVCALACLALGLLICYPARRLWLRPCSCIARLCSEHVRRSDGRTSDHSSIPPSSGPPALAAVWHARVLGTISNLLTTRVVSVETFVYRPLRCVSFHVTHSYPIHATRSMPTPSSTRRGYGSTTGFGSPVVSRRVGGVVLGPKRNNVVYAVAAPSSTQRAVLGLSQRR